MLRASLISLFVLPFTATCLLAQANNMTSGRPSATLNPEQCAAIWKNAVPSGDLLAQSAAAPFIVNFTQVDTDGSGDISKSEFEAACAKGPREEHRKLVCYRGASGYGAPCHPYLSGECLKARHSSRDAPSCLDLPGK